MDRTIRQPYHRSSRHADTRGMNQAIRTILKPFLSSRPSRHICDPTSTAHQRICLACRLGDPYTMSEPRYTAPKPTRRPRPTRHTA